MADYPCDYHLARYSGPSNRLYLNIYQEDRAVKLKASVCGDCLADIVACWLERALHATQGGGWDPGEDGQTLECLWIDAGRGSEASGYRNRR